MSLTEVEIRAAKGKAKDYKIYDALLVKPRGGKVWRLKYYLDRAEKLLSLGLYPDVSLKSARARRDEARRLVAEGVDPTAKRKVEQDSTADTFSAIAQEWLLTKKETLSESTWQRDHDQLIMMLGPNIGRRPITQIEAPQLLSVLRNIESKGSHDTAHRVRAVCGRVFRYAIATGRATRDISADLKGALAPKGTESYAAITDPAKSVHYRRPSRATMASVQRTPRCALPPTSSCVPGSCEPPSGRNSISRRRSGVFRPRE